MDYNLYLVRKQIDDIKVGNSYEFTNIIDRLLINVYNKYPDSYDKAKEECREKKMDFRVINKVKEMINENKVDIKADEQTYTEIISNNSELSSMFTIITKKYPDTSVIERQNCVFRYAALGQHGQQWRLDSKILDTLKQQGITIEAFASPFNNYFDNYYSIFEEDKCFGSLGSFLRDECREANGCENGVYVNPPFTPFILDVIPKLVSKFKKCVVITPSWTDADWYIKMQADVSFKNPLGTEPSVFKQLVKSNVTYSLLEKEFVPKFKTTIWYRGVEL